MKPLFRFLIPRIPILITLLLFQVGCTDDAPTDPAGPESPGNGRIYATRVNGSVNEVVSMKTDGTDLRVLQQHATIMSSPQAGKLLLITDAGQTLLADLDGKIVRTIPTLEAPAMAVLSPDASKICYGYQGSGPGLQEVYTLRIVNIDGTGDVLITEHGGWENTVAFSPDSKRIAFYFDEKAPFPDNAPDKLFTVNTDGTNMRLVADYAQSSPDRFGNVEWNSNGDRILFSGQGNVWTVRSDGSDAREMSDHSVCSLFPTFSPDGTMVAMCGSDSGGTGLSRGLDLWIMNSDGPNKQRLAPSPGFEDVELYPHWSPDGKSILCVSVEQYPQQALAITGKLKWIDAATGVSKFLTVTPNIFNAFWGRK